MIELPEAMTLACQVNDAVVGKRIQKVTAAHSPHKFAWYYGDPHLYHNRLVEKTISQSTAIGGLVEIRAETAVILLADGVGLRFHQPDTKRPTKHQLLIEFEDSSAVSASVQMYGGLLCFEEGDYDSPYYQVAKEKPAPLSSAFDRSYFDRLTAAPGVQKLSMKAFLATEQRIPGLGNGVLQDILYHAGIHPKRKISTLGGSDLEVLYQALKTTLADMASQGGRDTEKDLYSHYGGYQTRLSKKTVGKPCPICDGMIKKESYLGGSIYYCPGCQAL